MTIASVHAGAVQKILAVLAATGDVTKYIPAANMYVSHISTIKDPKFPALSIFISGARGMSSTEANLVRAMFQFDIWMPSMGANAFTWDDVFACYQNILTALHQVDIYDASMNARFIEIMNIHEGPQMWEEETMLMHWPSRWEIVLSPT